MGGERRMASVAVATPTLSVPHSVLGLILGQGAEWKNKSEKSLKEWEIQLV